MFGLALTLLCLSADNSALKHQQIEKLLKSFQQEDLFSGTVKVLQGNETVFEGAFGFANREWQVPNQIDTRFHIASVTKPLTTALILRLVDKGKIQSNQTIAELLPNFQAKWAGQITLDHLMTHQSGIPRAWSDYSDKDPNHHFKRAEILEIIANLNLDFEPGTSYAYSNIGYLLLAEIAAQVDQSSFEVALKKWVLDPCDMRSTGLFRERGIIAKRATGYEFGHLPDRPLVGTNGIVSEDWGAGGLYSTVDDLTKFANGISDLSFLSEELKEMMFTKNESGYGLGWQILQFPEPDPLKIVMHTGADGKGFNSAILHVLGMDITIAILSNENPLGRRHGSLVLQSILQIMLNQTQDVQPPKTVVKTLMDILKSEGVNKALAYYDTLEKNPFPKRRVGPRQATGEPNSGPGESSRAWASATGDDQREWLELTFDPPVEASELLVYENLGPGAIDGVLASSNLNSSKLDLSKSSTSLSDKQVNIFRVPFNTKLIRTIRLEINSPAIKGWNMIDAVGLKDKDGNIQWASDAKASSTAADNAEIDLFATPYLADFKVWQKRYANLGLIRESQKVQELMDKLNPISNPR